MTCPHCHTRAPSAVRTLETRSIQIGDQPSVRRRRHCTKCDHKWTTVELPAPAGTLQIAVVPLVYVKQLRLLQELIAGLQEIRRTIEPLGVAEPGGEGS